MVWTLFFCVAYVLALTFLAHHESHLAFSRMIPSVIQLVTRLGEPKRLSYDVIAYDMVRSLKNLETIVWAALE